MKKILAILLLCVVAFGASAEFRWGPTVGVNISNTDWSQNLVATDQLVGFQGGVMGEIMIPGIGFGLDIALKYQMQGGKVHFGDQFVWASEGYGTTDLYLHTIAIPLNIRFKYTRLNGVENVVAPFVFAGPQFNFHISNSDCDAVKRTAGSVGIQCGLGAELWKKYQVSASYMWNLTDDVHTKVLDNFHARMKGWYVNFAVLF